MKDLQKHDHNSYLELHMSKIKQSLILEHCAAEKARSSPSVRHKASACLAAKKSQQCLPGIVPVTPIFFKKKSVTVPSVAHNKQDTRYVTVSRLPRHLQVTTS